MSDWKKFDAREQLPHGPIFLSDGKVAVAAHWYESPATKFAPASCGWVLAGGDGMCGVDDLLDKDNYDWFAPADFIPTHWMPMLELPGV